MDPHPGAPGVFTPTHLQVRHGEQGIQGALCQVAEQQLVHLRVLQQQQFQQAWAGVSKMWLLASFPLPWATWGLLPTPSPGAWTTSEYMAAERPHSPSLTWPSGGGGGRAAQ